METLATSITSLKEKTLLQVARELASTLSQNITEEEKKWKAFFFCSECFEAGRIL